MSQGTAVADCRGEDQPVSVSGPGRPGMWFWAAGLGIWILHGLLLLHYFGGPGSLVSSEPLMTDDHAWHFYYSMLGSRFFQEHGTTWGYDPF